MSEDNKNIGELADSILAKTTAAEEQLEMVNPENQAHAEDIDRALHQLHDANMMAAEIRDRFEKQLGPI